MVRSIDPGAFDERRPPRFAPLRRIVTDCILRPGPVSSGPVSMARADRLRVAIAGAGLMGRWHRAAAQGAGATVVAIADPDPARAGRLAGKTVAVFSDVAAMLDSTRPDVLHICTPTATHAALLALAAARGVHVFAEKPMAADTVQTQALLALAQAHGILLCPVHQYAFQTSVETILRDRARAGVAALVDLAFFSAGAAGQPPAAYAAIAADILPHPVSILQRLFPGALPAPADWQVTPAGPGVGPGVGSYMLSTTMAGALVRISLSLTARPTCATLDYRGSTGSFAADHFHDYVLFRGGPATRRSKMTRPFSDALGHLGLAATNLAARALRGEMAYPGLLALCRRFYVAVERVGVDGAQNSPISAEDILAGAALRDHFRIVTRAGGPEA